MDEVQAITALAALAQITRLETFRMLVAHEPEGISAGEIARLMAVPQNTMSSHLSILSRAGLIVGERHSRSVIYRANLKCLHETMLFLVKDCCGGRTDVCMPLVSELTKSCSYKKEKARG